MWPAWCESRHGGRSSSIHAEDIRIWKEIDCGQRLLDWDAWLGHGDGIEYLTPEGLGVRDRMVDDLSSFLGSNRLSKAVASDAYGQPTIPAFTRPPGLTIVEPVVAHQAGKFTDILRWWAAIEICRLHAVPGLSKVARDIRNDVRVDRVGHAQTQLTLAAQGLSRGALIRCMRASARTGVLVGGDRLVVREDDRPSTSSGR